MIVLLNCSINSYANDSISSTGELDSVRIAYDDLRIVNSKLVELECTKKINVILNNIIHNDSITTKSYKTINDSLNKTVKKYKKQRNIIFGVSIAAIAAFVVALFK